MRETHNLNLSRESLLSLTSSISRMSFGFAGFALFARILEPAEFGSYLFVVVAGEMLANIPNGVGTAIKKRVSEADPLPGELLGAGFFFQAFFIVILAAIVFPAESLLNRFIDVPEAAVGLLAYVATYGSYRIVSDFLEGIGYPGYSSWIDTGRSALTLGSQVTLLMYTDLGSLALLLGLIVGYFMATVLTLFFCRTVPHLPSRKTIAKLWEFGRWSIPDAMVSDVYGKIDTFIIMIIIGSAAVSYYQIPTRLVQPAAFVSGSIAAPLMVRTSGRHSRNKNVIQDLESAISYTPIIAIAILFGSIAIPEAILTTAFGADYSTSGAVLIGLALYQVLQAFSNPMMATLEGIGSFRLEFYKSIVGVSVNLIFGVILGSLFGVIGVVIATILAELTNIAIFQYAIKREFGKYVLPQSILSQIFGGAIMSMFIGFISKQINITGWLSLVLIIVVGATFYFGTLFIIWKDFRDMILELIPALSS